MPNPDQNPGNWSEIVLGYERAFEPLTLQFAAELLSRLGLKPGERVIDVAAGTGAFSLLAARAGIDVLATDFSPGMISRLRERIRAEGLEHITAEVMDGQALTVPDDSFDAGVSILGVIFFPDISKGLSELHRVVRSHGYAGVVCWSDPVNLKLMSILMQAILKVVPGFQHPTAPPVWARLAGAQSVKEQMQQAGFQEVEITRSSASLQINSPQAFWAGFTRSAPPVAYLFERLGPGLTEAVGQAYMELLSAGAGAGTPALSVEACIGIGRINHRLQR